MIKIILVSLLLIFTHSQVIYSALRLCDSSICQITLKLTGGKYILTWPINITQNNNLIFCFRQITITKGTQDTCTLGGGTTKYDCFQVLKSTYTLSYFTEQSTLNGKSATAATKTLTTSVVAGTVLLTLDISQILSTSKIYEARVGYQQKLISDPVAKKVYFQTFITSSATGAKLQNNTDNLLMQRKVECIQFYYFNKVNAYYNFNLLFYGGVVRDGTNTMIMHVLSLLYDSSIVYAPLINLNAWLGICFSTSHSNRDMIAFLTANSTLFDMYSLFSSNPFIDTSTNIGASSDLISIADSRKQSKTSTSGYYWGGFTRPYSTGDTQGDQILRYKISLQYCFAAGYSTQSNTLPTSPVNSSIHDYTYCFTPSIQVAQIYIKITFLFLIILTLL